MLQKQLISSLELLTGQGSRSDWLSGLKVLSGVLIGNWAVSTSQLSASSGREKLLGARHITHYKSGFGLGGGGSYHTQCYLQWENLLIFNVEYWFDWELLDSSNISKITLGLIILIKSFTAAISGLMIVLQHQKISINES